MPIATIDIAIPVLNEEKTIRQSVTALAERLDTRCPYEWSITIIDNGSNDNTWSIAGDIADQDPRVRAIRMERRGRGGALKHAWTTSTADVVAYMDVDLSTGLESLSGLIDPLVEGSIDLSIGSRLVSGAKVRRSYRREIISRIYNMITRLAFGYPIKDAQCGFKAVRRDVALSLLPGIEDDGWFFDTELIVAAWRNGLRILEVPVRWVEDEDSRVRIITTALDDLRGIRRLVAEGKRRRREGSYDSQGTVLQASPSHESDDWPKWDFDAHAETYDGAVDQSVAFTGRTSAFFAQRKCDLLSDLARDTVGDLGGLSVLDVGCGTGSTDRYLVDIAGSLTGIDVSQKMIDIASKAVPQAKYEWYNGDKLPFPDGTFDVVIAACVLHHVPVSARAKLVAEMHRVTRHEGLVAIFEHNPHNLLTRHAVNSCDLDDGVVLVQAGKAMAYARIAGAVSVARSHYLFTPFGGQIGRSIDRALNRLPVGGQYVVSARARHVS